MPKLSVKEIEQIKTEVAGSKNWEDPDEYFNAHIEAGAQALSDKLSKLSPEGLREEIAESIFRDVPAINLTSWGDIKKEAPDLVEDCFAKADRILSLLNSQIEQARLGGIKLAVDEGNSAYHKGQQESIDAMVDYTSGKISFERCAERMNMNFYELAEFCSKKEQVIKDGK